jgi:hypothetical protein
MPRTHVDPQTQQLVRRPPMGLTEGMVLELIPDHIAPQDANIMVKNGDLIPFEGFIGNEPPLDFEAMAASRYVDVELLESERSPKIMVNGVELARAGMALEVPPIGSKQVQLLLLHPTESPAKINGTNLPPDAGFSINLRATGEKVIEFWVPVVSSFAAGTAVNLSWTKGIRSLKVTQADGTSAYLIRPAPVQTPG